MVSLFVKLKFFHVCKPLCCFFIIITGKKPFSFILVKLKYFDTYQNKVSLHLHITIHVKYSLTDWFINSNSSFMIHHLITFFVSHSSSETRTKVQHTFPELRKLEIFAQQNYYKRQLDLKKSTGFNSMNSKIPEITQFTYFLTYLKKKKI